MAALGLLHLDYTYRCTGKLHGRDRMSESRLQEFYDKIRADLDRTVKFWRQHSRDPECGYGQGLREGEYCFCIIFSKYFICLMNVYCSGFFNCLGKDGKVYDEIKHVWLQARQVRVCYHQ